MLLKEMLREIENITITELLSFYFECSDIKNNTYNIIDNISITDKSRNLIIKKFNDSEIKEIKFKNKNNVYLNHKIIPFKRWYRTG